jgi:hypothetical protein
MKIIAIILAIVLVVTVGYLIVKTVINLFNGFNLGEAFGASWWDITHLWGLIKDKVQEGVQEFPMANQQITWNTARSW